MWPKAISSVLALSQGIQKTDLHLEKGAAGPTNIVKSSLVIPYNILFGKAQQLGLRQKLMAQ